jgi:hypothetical protein
MINGIDAVYQSSIDRVVAFVTADDDQLHYAYATGTGGWSWGASLGLPPGTPPDYPIAYPTAAYRSSIDQVMAFVCGMTDGNLYRAYWNGSAWAWDGPLNSPGLTIAVTAGVIPVDAIYVSLSDHVLAFAIGLDGQLYLNWNYSASNWIAIGAPPSASNTLLLSSSPVALYQPTTGVVWVFVVGDDGHVYSAMSGAAAATSGSAAWSWGDLGAPPAAIVGPPTVTYQTSTSSTFIFVQCADGNLYVNSTGFAPAWGGWVNHGAPAGTKVSGEQIAAVSTLTNHVHVFVQSADGKLYDRYGKPNDEWTWDVHSSPPGNPPLGPAFAAVYQPSIDRVLGLVGGMDALSSGGSPPVKGSLYTIFTVLRWRWDDLGSPD